MTSEQSPEEKETKAVSENEENKGNISSPVEGSNQPNQSSDSQSLQPDDNDNDSLSIQDVLPPEVLEELPQNLQRQISFSMSRSSRQSSLIAEQLKPEHITQIIESSEKDSQREFDLSKISENTKRLGMGAILSLVVIVLVYAGVTKDKDLSEKVVLAGISAIGGYGAAYAFGKDK